MSCLQVIKIIFPDRIENGSIMEIFGQVIDWLIIEIIPQIDWFRVKHNWNMKHN